jgi:phosphoserine phosphatase
MGEIKAIFCDMDGTAVDYDNEPYHSSWDALLDILTQEEKKKWISTRDFFVQGNGDYDEWFNEQVKLLKGKELKDAEKALFPVPYSKGFFDFFIHNNCFRKAIISSGLDLVAKKISDELSFDDYVAQHLEVKEGFFTGKGNYFF